MTHMSKTMLFLPPIHGCDFLFLVNSKTALTISIKRGIDLRDSTMHRGLK